MTSSWTPRPQEVVILAIMNGREGHLHGMDTVAEAALQVQGRGGPRRAARHEVAVVTSGALMDGSALVLTPIDEEGDAC